MASNRTGKFKDQSCVELLHTMFEYKTFGQFNLGYHPCFPEDLETMLDRSPDALVTPPNQVAGSLALAMNPEKISHEFVRS